MKQKSIQNNTYFICAVPMNTRRVYLHAECRRLTPSLFDVFQVGVLQEQVAELIAKDSESQRTIVALKNHITRLEATLAIRL